jgi:hypothetical protein
MVHKEYISTYKKTTKPEENSALASVSKANKGGVLSFANISVGTLTGHQQNEIYKYLKLPVKNVLDPLK